jgi:signal transduction histidine kinase
MITAMARGHGLLQFLQGGGEMGALIRSKDWSATLLGASESWPQSLKTTLGILLNSRYPMFVFWGPQLIKIYNDGYTPILGRKHPWALGQPAREVWPEIWPAIEPLVDRALSGDPTWSDDLMLFMERNGFPEEVYFTFSYSPIPDETGGIGGMFCACTETTGQVLGERRLRTLRDLAAALAQTHTERDACAQAATLLHANAADVPFVVIYLLDESGGAHLAAQAGSAPGQAVAPLEIVRGREDEGWRVYDVVDSRSALLVESLRDRFTAIPAGPWPEHPDTAMVLPLIDRSLDRAIGSIVLGISSRRPFDADYRGWFDLVASQVGASITSARAVEQERRRAEALADLDRAKTAFFSNVSHEFRTPLTLMLGPTEEAVASSAGALSGEALRMVHRNQLRLLKLVNSLLDFSRLRDGRAEAHREATDLAAFTANLAAVFRSAIERADLKLIVNCDPMSGPLLIDREMWEKIVFNLLSNAFKFTLEGEIEVALRDRDGSVVLTVRDTGTGIPADELPRVFERFHRVVGAKGRTFEGSGIGLALVHELATLLGGTVSVESAVGRGSTFTVRLPHAALPQLAEGSQTLALAPLSIGSDGYLEEMLRTLPERDAIAAPASPASGRPCILVADDNADMRNYISGLLSPDYDVIAVADGDAALAAVQTQTVHLVLSDVMMPRLNGVELLERLRGDERTRTLPVILVSARAGEDDTVTGLHTGADDYLVKPFSARELIARVHARLQIAAERERREDALREADRRKDEFLAMLAHELRSPLAPIRSAAEVLRMGDPQGGPQQWAREVIERQTQHLTRLVDDLLDVSRITRGMITIRREPLDLGVIVQRSVETSRPMIDARHQQITVVLPERPLRVEGDMTRLVQVIANLLNNAAKYTEEGGHIAVEVRDESGMATVAVRDNGIGLSAELLPHVFDLFTQANQALDRSQGGLGIGLTLVRRLVELHGGTVQAKSAGAGQGSEFIVRLPMLADEARATDAGGTHAGEPSAVTRALRVLVVEDHPDSADMMAFLIEAQGHKVFKAHDGASALDTALAVLPDVMFCDIGLPGMNGYELAAEIRRQPRLGQVRLIAISGYGREEDRRRAETAGFDAHLTKPIEPDVLHSLLQLGVDRA